MSLDWKDVRTIAETIYDSDPERYPLSIRFTDLHQQIVDLPNFKGDPEDASEKILEAIQMIWYEEWKADHDEEDDPYANWQRPRSGSKDSR